MGMDFYSQIKKMGHDQRRERDDAVRRERDDAVRREYEYQEKLLWANKI